VLLKHWKKVVVAIISGGLTCGIIFCSSSNPYLPQSRIVALIQAQISGPVYQGNFYKNGLVQTDYAAWIEDENGNYIKTLRVSKGAVFIAKTGIHAEHLPTWKKVAGIQCTTKVAHDSLGYFLKGYDAISSASLKLSATKDTMLTLKWDFTDSTGKALPEGTYKFCIETASIRKDSATATAPSKVIINAEHTSGVIVSRKEHAIAATATLNIKSLKANVSSLFSDTAHIDGVTSATPR